jgi:hypothetical protein
MQCSTCQHENPAGALFCGECRASLSEAGSLPASAPGVADTVALPVPTPVTAPGPDVVRPKQAGGPPTPRSEATLPSADLSGPEDSWQQYEATRYLCAAVHLNSGLAEQLVEQVLEEPLLGIARSPGIDLVAVMRHVVAARARHLIREASLVAAIVLMLISAALGSGWLFLLFFVLSWVVIFVEAYQARWGATAHKLRRGSFTPEGSVPEIPLAKRRLTEQQLQRVDEYQRGNVTAYRGFDPFVGHGWTLDSWSFALDTTIRDDEEEPVEEFTASELQEWIRSRVADLDLPGLAVGDRLFVSGADVHHDGRFLVATDVRYDGRPATDTGVPRRPVARVTEEMLESLRERPEDRARPYLAVEVVGWGGQLVYTLFLRLHRSASHLFVEANHTLLPPLHWAYYEVDDLLMRPTVRQFLWLVLASGARWPVMILLCVPRTARQLFAGSRQRRRQRRQLKSIRQQFTFDHGARISVREAASDLRSRVPQRFPSLGPLEAVLGPVLRAVLGIFLDNGGRTLGYHRYFQILDKEMYTKVAEKRIFDALAEFLEDRNIDAGELRRRVETIINNSLSIGDNNNFNGVAMSVGRGAASTASSGKPSI